MGRFSKGWVKAWRDAVEGDLPQNVWLWGIWNWLLLSATWKPSKVLWNGKQREIPPGTVVMGLVELSTKWDCSKNTIKKWLNYLEITERISIETCTRGTLVTIRNWSLYQTQDSHECTPTAREVHTDCTPTAHQVTLSKESKKEEEYIGLDFEKIYLEYPKRKGTQRKSKGMEVCQKKFNSPERYEALLAATKNYASFCKREKKTGTEFVAQFATFVGGIWEEWASRPALVITPVQQTDEEIEAEIQAKRARELGSHT